MTGRQLTTRLDHFGALLSCCCCLFFPFWTVFFLFFETQGKVVAARVTHQGHLWIFCSLIASPIFFLVRLAKLYNSRGLETGMEVSVTGNFVQSFFFFFGVLFVCFCAVSSLFSLSFIPLDSFISLECMPFRVDVDFPIRFPGTATRRGLIIPLGACASISSWIVGYALPQYLQLYRSLVVIRAALFPSTVAGFFLFSTGSKCLASRPKRDGSHSHKRTTQKIKSGSTKTEISVFIFWR